MAMAMLSSPPARSNLSTLPSPPSISITHLNHHKPCLPLISRFNKRTHFLSLSSRATADNGAGIATSSPTIAAAAATSLNDEKTLESSPLSSQPIPEDRGDVGTTTSAASAAEVAVKKFEDPRWVNGTWDLKQFSKDGSSDWDAVIDAEARRRKWLEENPESSSNEEPVVFDTSIIPWWAWIKKFHLPEAELLNGRAAMIGFFMAYFVDSLTGVGLVDQMGNLFCKTLLFVAVLGVLLFRKNEDVENLKKLLEETTFYDKQWQATWQDDTSGVSQKD